MSTEYTSLYDLGPVALSHRSQLDEVKAEIGITHGYFDAWIYGFFENKKFDVPETVAKLRRRFEMEVNVLATYEFTDFMRQSLRKGIIQEIGYDKIGRVVMYVFTKRDIPKAKYRDENRMIFDVFTSHGTRLRQDNKRSQMVMLINQEDSSFFTNIDIAFQGEVALRISKFYPGMVDKIFVCKMGSTLSMMAKPILSRLPAVVSDRIEIITPNDIKKGTLLEYFDASVLPVELGGTNDCDTEAHWTEYAETLENYYSRMKTAIRDRGLSVKQWELEELGIDTQGHSKDTRSSPSPMPMSLGNSFRSFPGSATIGQKQLLSCRSDYGVVDNEEADDGYADEWRDIFKDFSMPLALFFADEFLRWSKAIREQEESERYKILQTYAAEFTALSESKGLSLHVSELYKNSLFPIVALAKFWIVIITVLSSIYFAIALLFYAILTADLVGTLYLGFFLKSTYYFPLSCAMVVTFIQGTALCTRSLDIIYAIWEGKVIPPLERLGPRVGVFAEVILFALITIVQVVVFCIYAAKDGAAVGLQYAFATAWLLAVCIIFLNHALFFSGFFNERDHSRTDKRVFQIPFFLAFRSSPAEHQKSLVCDTSVVVSVVLLSSSALLGVGFLISRIVALYVSTIVCSIITAYIVQFFCEEFANSLSGFMMTTAIWIFCFTWMFATFAFGFYNQDSSWMWPVIVSCAVSGFLIVGSYICLRKRRSASLLRVLYLFALLYFLASWIATFPVVNWKLGVFTIALMLHNLINIIFAPCRFTDSRASFLVACASLLVIVSCLLLGWEGSVAQWNEGDSFTTPETKSNAEPLESLHLFHQYPVCTIKFGSLFSVVDLSYLLELGAAVGQPEVINTGISSWFQGKDLQYDGIKYQSDKTDLYVQKFSSSTDGLSFLVMQEFSPWFSILSMDLWIDAIALRPITILLPEDWNLEVIHIMSFVSQMIPFAVRDSIEDIQEILRNEDSSKTILCSSGTAGGIAAAASAKTGVHSVIFSSGGIRDIETILGINDADYHRYVLNINAVYGIEGYYGGYDVSVAQRVWCNDNILTCISQDFMTSTLQDACIVQKEVNTF